ncbi:MAG: DUF3263 domain-containing protein [Homoserinimonas sp.]
MDAATDQQAGELSERDQGLLEFENRNWRNPGSKEQAIRLELGISAARYYQLLNALIDSPAAARYDPLLVSRLRRMRAGRTHAGAGR